MTRDPLVTFRLKESVVRRLVAGLHRGSPAVRDEIRTMLSRKVSRRWLRREETRVRSAIYGSSSGRRVLQHRPATPRAA